MTGEQTPLHVLMLLDSTYPPPRGGGTEMQIRTLAKGLRRRGHRVTVLAPLTEAGPQRKIGRLDGVPVCRLPYPRIRLIGGLWLMVRLFLFLLSRHNRYDAWHAHFPHNLSAVVALLGRWLDKPEVVVKVASSAEFETGTLALHPSVLSRVTYLCLQHADSWQAISQRIANALVARGIPRDRIAAIPNAVDVTRFLPRPRYETDHPRFLFVGRLVAAKNLFTLLEAFAGVLRVQGDAQLRIVGGGPLETSLRQCASALGIESNVEFTGHRENIETFVAESDFGVLPSSFEGLSNSLLEFMASGLPMIASRVSGNEDLVCPGENGWLFEPNDRAGLTTCLIEAAMLTPKRRLAMGDNARKTVERHAGLDSVIDRLLTLYRGPTATTAPALPTAKEGV